MRPLSAVALALCVTGCADMLLTPEPTGDPVAVFAELWGEFDRYYSHFEIKGVDWTALGDQHRARVAPVTTGPQLFAVLAEMLDVLRDGHINVWTPFGVYAWEGWHEGYPASFSAPRANAYVTGGRTAPGGVFWGHVGSEIGYIRIPSFEDRDVVEGVDAAVEGLSDVRGVIVDVRHNGGGSSDRAVAIAGRFAAAAYHYGTVQYRTGPGRDDYAPPRQDSVRPAGTVAYHGPVTLLTNRRVFSAAETFVLAMRVLPQVTVVGDTTGGGSGNPIMRELSNGWVYRIPRWIARTPEGGTYEGVGLGPDLWVQFDPTLASVIGDPIVDSALAFLRR
jgi:hypothetical protein